MEKFHKKSAVTAALLQTCWEWFPYKTKVKPQQTRVSKQLNHRVTINENQALD